jgi:vacuolar protein sorting-associated protein 33A
MQGDTAHDAHILFIPSRTIECDELLHENQLLFEDRISHFSLDLLMLDEDLLSLELPNNFMHYMLQDDDSYKVYAQKSIIRLETVFGQIKHKFAKGNISAQILNKIKQHN